MENANDNTREIIKLLAQELGFGQYFQMTDEEALTELFGCQINESLGISYERVKSEGDVSFAAKPYQTSEGQEL